MTEIQTAFGRVAIGDTVYVDEGDSIGCREFTGKVTRASAHSVTVQPARGRAVTIDPARVADIQVVA